MCSWFACCAAFREQPCILLCMRVASGPWHLLRICLRLNQLNQQILEMLPTSTLHKKLAPNCKSKSLFWPETDRDVAIGYPLRGYSQPSNGWMKELQPEFAFLFFVTSTSTYALVEDQDHTFQSPTRKLRHGGHEREDDKLKSFTQRTKLSETHICLFNLKILGPWSSPKQNDASSKATTSGGGLPPGTAAAPKGSGR